MQGLLSGCGAAEPEIKRVVSTHGFPAQLSSWGGAVWAPRSALGLKVCLGLCRDPSTALVIFDLDSFSLHLKVQVFHFQPLNVPTYELP